MLNSNSNSKSFIYDKGKNVWNDKIKQQQLSFEYGSNIFEFSNNLKYLSNIPNISQPKKGIIYFYQDSIASDIVPMYFVGRKFQLNDGSKFLPSNIINYANNRSTTFTSEINLV